MSRSTSSEVVAAPKHRSGSRLTPGGAVLIVLVVALLFALAVPLRTLLQQRSDLARVQREELVLQQQNDSLKKQVSLLNDPAYLERLARQCLGMVKPGEIPFVVVPRGGGAPTSGAQAAPAIDAPGGC